MADPFWVALSLSRHIGGKTMRALLKQFDGDVRAILRAEETLLRRVHGVGPATIHDIQQLDPLLIGRLMEQWRAEGVHILAWDDPDYPPTLRDLGDAPPTLFALGALHLPRWHRAVAVVGKRHPSPLGAKCAWQIGAQLAGKGYTVVSGLAYGIDKAAHEGALSVGGGCTVAMLGCGVLNIYPPQHQQLAQHIRRRGALISETHPAVGANAPRLVARNRLITGLATHGVIVVETEADGGAMHAARRAREQGRALYALDLPASGNRALIQNGDAIPLRPDLSDWPFP